MFGDERSGAERHLTRGARGLVAWSGALFVVVLIGALVAIAAGWPAQFGGGGDPTDVASESLSRGTALSPPLAPVLLFVVALALAVRAGTLGKIGTVLVMLVSVVFVVGGLGEAFAAPTPDVPKAALVLSGLLAVLFATGVIVAAIQRLRHSGPHVGPES